MFYLFIHLFGFIIIFLNINIHLVYIVNFLLLLAI